MEKQSDFMMKNEFKILIIGASSFIIDKNLFEKFFNKKNIYYISSKNPKKNNKNYLNIDFSKCCSQFTNKIKNLTLIKFDMIILLSHLRSHENKLDKNFFLNFIVNNNIKIFLSYLNFTKLVYLSSYSVYDSLSLDKSKFIEFQLNNNDYIYGQSKFFSEFFFKQFKNKTYILRIPNIADNVKNNKSAHLKILKKIKEKSLLKDNYLDKRYYVYIKDIYHFLFNLCSDNKKLVNSKKTINLHSERSSVFELSKKILKYAS